MNTKQITSRSYKVTPDDGKWLTLYQDNQDIRTFYSCKEIFTTKKGISDIREITDEENEDYLNRKAIAEASMTDEQPMP